MTLFTRILFVSTLAISLAGHFTMREQVTGSRLLTKQTSKFPLATKDMEPGGEVSTKQSAHSEPSPTRRGQGEVPTKQNTPSEPSPPRRGQGEVPTKQNTPSEPSPPRRGQGEVPTKQNTPSEPSPTRRGQGEVPTKQNTPSEPSPLRRGQGEVLPSETPMLSVNGEAQGTTYHIRYFDNKNRNLKKEIDSLLGDFDKCLSLYRPDSEISRFNKADSHRFESPYFYPVLKKSREVFSRNAGCF